MQAYHKCKANFISSCLQDVKFATRTNFILGKFSFAIARKTKAKMSPAIDKLARQTWGKFVVGVTQCDQIGRNFTTLAKFHNIWLFL